MTTDALDRVTRYRRTHEKGFHTALTRLRELRATERLSQSRPLDTAIRQFATEADCVAHLMRRLRHHEFRCPRCAHAHGYWLDERRRWQCAGCGQQSGLRAGTVMEGSPLPLKTWFAASRAILTNANASTRDLAQATGIHRAATVRRVAAKIRAALASPHAAELLAGLDQVFAQE